MSKHGRSRCPDDSKRRSLLKLGAGGALVAAGTALPARWTRPLVESAVLPAHAQATMVSGPFFNSSPIVLLADAGESIMDRLFPSAYANGAPTFQLCIDVSGLEASVLAYVASGVGIADWFSGTACVPGPTSIAVATPTALSNSCGGAATASILITAVGASIQGTFQFESLANNFDIGPGICSTPPVTCPR